MACSVACGSKSPSIQFLRQGARHRIFGCPGKHLCDSVLKWYGDYDMQKDGIMAPYSFREMPGKYSDFAIMYKDWHGFFTHRREKQSAGYTPRLGRGIELFRQQEKARGR